MNFESPRLFVSNKFWNQNIINDPLFRLTNITNKNNIFVTYGWGLNIALIPSLLLYAKLKNGILISPDSLTYLFAARGLLNNGELSNLYGETSLTVFPPLYPVFLALVQLSGVSGESAAEIISIGSIFISTLAVFLCIQYLFGNLAVSGVFSLLIFVHPHMQGVFMYAYSETIFISILSLLLLICSVLDGSNIYKISIFIGLLTGLAFLTRYGALAIIPAVGIVLLSLGSVPVRKRIVACLFFSLSCALIIGPWLLRNYLVDGTLFGPRIESEDTLIFALRRVALVTTEWLSPVHFTKYFKLGSGITFILLYGFLSALYLKKSAKTNPVLPLVLIFTITHAALMVYTQISTVVDPIDTRYMSPLIAPIVISLISLIYFLTEKLNLQPVKITLGVGLFFISVHGINSFQQISSSRIHNSQATLKIEELPAECFNTSSAVYSNDFTFLRYNQIIPHAKELPRQYIYRRSIRRDNWLHFVESIKTNPAYLVWIKNNSSSNPEMEDLIGGLSENVVIELISTNEHYNVYRANLH